MNLIGFWAAGCGAGACEPLQGPPRVAGPLCVIDAG